MPSDPSRPRDDDTLTATYRDSTASRIELGLGQIERLTDPQTRPPQEHDQRPQPHSIGVAAGLTHHGDDLLNRGRICLIPPALVPRRAPVVKAGQRDRRPAMTSRARLD
jgi:hypothetical protein